jgi:hypothetical protein
MCSCPTPAGRSMCHCAACHRNFTSPASFTMHQSVGGGGVICHDPAAKRLVLVSRTEDGAELWGQAGTRPPGTWPTA